MGGFLENIQPAVKKETKRVAASTAIGVILMWILFAVLHMSMPDSIPFDYTVFLGGIGGWVAAVLNFFLMGLTVQKVVDTEDEELARMRMKSSYSRRMMLQFFWVIAAIVLPCFHFAAGILPLLFPGIGIKVLGILNK